MSMKKKILLMIILPVAVAVIAFSYGTYRRMRSGVALAQGAAASRVFSAADLQKFNGNDPNLPIYIGYEGYVYDVSAGRNFYQAGAAYHFLAGKDSTTELHIFGGDIIKRKYPIIGRLAK
ncbi:cytochrome b5 domain-containing protein [bacterium]|nr:MAG: cytochrome b5 domain-containing protein [bacterium]